MLAHICSMLAPSVCLEPKLPSFAFGLPEATGTNRSSICTGKRARDSHWPSGWLCEALCGYLSSLSLCLVSEYVWGFSCLKQVFAVLSPTCRKNVFIEKRWNQRVGCRVIDSTCFCGNYVSKLVTIQKSMMSCVAGAIMFLQILGSAHKPTCYSCERVWELQTILRVLSPRFCCSSSIWVLENFQSPWF